MQIFGYSPLKTQCTLDRMNLPSLLSTPLQFYILDETGRAHTLFDELGNGIRQMGLGINQSGYTSCVHIMAWLSGLARSVLKCCGVVLIHFQGQWHLSGAIWMWSRPTLRCGKGTLSSLLWRLRVGTAWQSCECHVIYLENHCSQECDQLAILKAKQHFHTIQKFPCTGSFSLTMATP